MAAGNSSQFQPPGGSEKTRENLPGHTYTLDPLLTEGPDALVPDETDQILSIKLCRIDLGTPNAFHEVTTKTADDLFCSASATTKPTSPFPAGTELLRATFAFLFKDFPAPHAVDISPPATLTLEFPADAPRVHRFLSKRRFASARAAQASAGLLLALLLAIAPALDDNDADDDDDDGDGERIVHLHPHRLSHRRIRPLPFSISHSRPAACRLSRPTPHQSINPPIH